LLPFWLQRPDRQIVGEGQRTGSHRGEIIDAHRHQIESESPEALGRSGQLDLGAYAIRTHH
jgi:hypothetical protein